MARYIKVKLKTLQKYDLAPAEASIRRKNKIQTRKSAYGERLDQKQKLKIIYGVMEGQMKRYVREAFNSQGDPQLELLKKLEMRLDNVAYRLGYGKTRSQARQLVNHGHVLVNDKKVDIPSYLLKIGQTISLRKKTLNKRNFSETIENNRKTLTSVSYLDYKKDSGVFVGFNGAGAAGIYSFTRVLRDRGYKVDFYGIGEIYFKQQVDELLIFPKKPLESFMARWKLFFKLLPKYDVWHFNWSQTLFFYPLNILLLKLYGKKIVVTFRGSDVETELDFTKTNPVIVAHKSEWPSYFKNFHHLSWQAKLFKRIRTAFLTFFADKAVINGPYLATSAPGYDLLIPYARDLSKIEKFKKAGHRTTGNGKLTVIHVPSEPEVKGTHYVKEAFKNLGPKYPNVEFKILDFMPYDDLLEEMSKADIVIDQLLVGWYGGQAVEAMVLAKTVMCFLEPSYIDIVSFGKEIPIVNTTIFSFEKDLEDLINDPDRRQKLAAAGPDFVYTHHDAEKVADSYQKVYEEVLK